MKNFCFVFLLLPFLIVAQRKKDQDTSLVIQQLARIEFQKANSDTEFSIISGEETGLLVVERTGEIIKDRRVWRFYKVTRELSIEWSKIETLPIEGDLVGSDWADGSFHLLFNTSPYRSQDLYSVKIDGQTSKSESLEISTVFPISMTHFEVLGTTILIAGYVNYRPVVVTFNEGEQSPNVIPGFYEIRNQLLDVIVDDESDIFTVVLSERMKNKKFTTRIKSFTSDGDLIQDNVVNPGEEKSLLDAASTSFEGGVQLIAGTHSKKSIKYSQGFFLSKFINGNQVDENFIPFADLENFFSHLNPGRERRLKKRIARKREKGKVKRFNFRLVVHDILEKNDQYIMIAESYYPRYNSSQRRTSYLSSGYTPPSVRSNQYFLGNRFTYAVLVSFDKNCNVLWDQTFKIQDVDKLNLLQNISVSFDGNSVAILHLEENEIRSKVVEADSVIEKRSYTPINLSFEIDELRTRDPEVESINSWYGNYSYAYGQHSVKNRSNIGGSPIRRVFYINKIGLDPRRVQEKE